MLGAASLFPRFHRYVAAKFLSNLFITLTATILVVGFITIILFLNLAKVKFFKLIAGYTLASVLLFVPVFFGLVVLVALALTSYGFLKSRLSMVVFSLGISPSVFLQVFALFGVLFFFVSLFYFEFVYPKASLLQHVTYLESKKKKVKRGILENFWLKKENLFLYARLVNLDRGRAFGGELIKVNDRFEMVSVVPFSEAEFSAGENLVSLAVREAKEYTPSGVREVKNLSLSFPYDEELLRARKPQFLPLSDLFRLTLVAKKLGINDKPFAWELEKRLLVSFLLLWIFLYGGINFFKSVSGREILKKVTTAAALTVGFYLFLFLYQSAVIKASLNPHLFSAVMLPYGYLLWRDWRRD